MSTDPTAGGQPSNDPTAPAWSAGSSDPTQQMPNSPSGSPAPSAPAPSTGTSPSGVPGTPMPPHGDSAAAPTYGVGTQSGQPYPPTYAPPPAPGYGAGAYGAMYGGREHPQGTIILILGILSIVVCQLTGPFAWSMGKKALAEIDANPSAYTNRGQVQAGYICGIVGSVLLILGILFMIFYFVVIGAALAGSSR